jgi:serine/threonine protein kinase
MGRVYEAHQESPSRTVAVKVIRQGLTSEKTLKRFEREAEFLGKLQHPGIAQIYIVGAYESDVGAVPFFVMELIQDAKPITSYAFEQHLTLEERLELFACVCDAVAHGHARGIIHRDLKPGNLLVNEEGRPKVIDFGVARSTDSDLTLTKMKTDTGALVGTVAYMSPEQFGDSPEGLDGRADVYSLGVVLYELVSGSPPYQVRKKAMHEAARIVCEYVPPTLRAKDRSVPKAVSLIAEQCLKKNRVNRYATPGEIAADIRRFLAGQPVLARPVSILSRVSVALEVTLGRYRHWVVPILVGAVIAGLGLAFRPGKQPEPSVSPAGQSATSGAQGSLPSQNSASATSLEPTGGIKVVLSRDWTDLGVSLTRGVCYRLGVVGIFRDDKHGMFSADGSAGIHGSKFGPRSQLSVRTREHRFLDGHTRLAVLGRIGEDSRSFCVGKELTFIAPASGKLSLRLNESPDSATRAKGNATVHLEPTGSPIFVDEDGVTSIQARVAHEAFLVFEPEGVRWRRAAADDVGEQYPVFINDVAWFPDEFDGDTSGLLKTSAFAWTGPPENLAPLVAFATYGDPGTTVEAIELAQGPRAVRFRVLEGTDGEFRLNLSRPKSANQEQAP